MKRYFNIEFSDLSFDKQQELIAEIKAELLETWKEDGMTEMSKQWHVQPRTWQEAYCREYAVDHTMWNDLDEKSEEFQKFDWIGSLDFYAEEEAEKLCEKGFSRTEIEVFIGEGVR